MEKSIFIGGAVAAIAASAFALNASADTVKLTETQTLALYGTEIQGLFYTDRTQSSPEVISFEYAGYLSEYGFTGDGFTDGAVYYRNIGFMDNSRFVEDITSPDASYRAFAVDVLCNTGGVVYRANVTNLATIYPYGVYGNDAYNVQLHAPFSIRLQGISSIKHAVAWSCDESSYGSGAPFCAYNRQGVTTRYAGQSEPEFHVSAPGQSYANVHNPARAWLPMEKITGGNPDTMTVKWSKCIRCMWSPVDALGGGQDDFTSESLDAYCVRDYSPDGASLNAQRYIYIIITCPELTDYNPPAETVPPVTGETGLTGIGTTETGTNLNDISGDLREIIYNQRHQIAQNEVINENMRRTANNTAQCVELLDKIYKQLVKMGEVPVTGTDMWAAIDASIEGYTTARVPEEAENGITAWSSVIDIFLARFAWIAEIAVFSVVVGITGWILFRGRTS